MRSMVYVVTALAAVGIVVGIAMMPPTTTESNTAPASVSNVAADTAVMQEAGTLVMRVPDMHCPFACYPSVKSTLEASETVESVELVQQKEEGAIDKPEVIVKYEPGFDVNAAIASLAQKGFKKAEVVQ